MQVNRAMQAIRAVQAIEAKHVTSLVIQARPQHCIVSLSPAQPSLMLA